jgi:putative transposase
MARCTAERIMRTHSWRGVMRTQRVRITERDPAATARRIWCGGASARHGLISCTWPTSPTCRWPQGFGYTAFVIDAYAGLIPGWECSLRKDTAFVERAIRWAAARRAREGHPLAGDTIHHPNAGSHPVHRNTFH